MENIFHAEPCMVMGAIFHNQVPDLKLPGVIFRIIYGHGWSDGEEGPNSELGCGKRYMLSSARGEGCPFSTTRLQI